MLTINDVAVDISTLTENQSWFVRSESTFGAFFGPVACGKTYAGAVKAVTRALKDDNSRGIVTAPTFKQLTIEPYKKIIDILCDICVPYTFNITTESLTLGNGSVILFRSMENIDALRGSEFNWAWFDCVFDDILGENYRSWQFLKSRVRLQSPQAWVTGRVREDKNFQNEFLTYIGTIDDKASHYSVFHH
jgi:phage terminase large subunit-like protein